MNRLITLSVVAKCSPVLRPAFIEIVAAVKSNELVACRLISRTFGAQPKITGRDGSALINITKHKLPTVGVDVPPVLSDCMGMLLRFGRPMLESVGLQSTVAEGAEPVTAITEYS